mmetsp:Transcript_84592/g.236028  ORF Transcript_84592/g.236028 Transcript_84592/m.236028 type:complete len:176 (-) Transcript_84592:12-539(-)
MGCGQSMISSPQCTLCGRVLRSSEDDGICTVCHGNLWQKRRKLRSATPPTSALVGLPKPRTEVRCALPELTSTLPKALAEVNVAVEPCVFPALEGGVQVVPELTPKLPTLLAEAFQPCIHDSTCERCVEASGAPSCPRCPRPIAAVAKIGVGNPKLQGKLMLDMPVQRPTFVNSK